MPGRHFLFVPGPAHVPDRVQRAMHRAMVDHRSSAFPELPLSVFRHLTTLFDTRSGRASVCAAPFARGGSSSVRAMGSGVAAAAASYREQAMPLDA